MYCNSLVATFLYTDSNMSFHPPSFHESRQNLLVVVLHNIWRGGAWSFHLKIRLPLVVVLDDVWSWRSRTINFSIGSYTGILVKPTNEVYV